MDASASEMTTMMDEPIIERRHVQNAERNVDGVSGRRRHVQAGGVEEPTEEIAAGYADRRSENSEHRGFKHEQGDDPCARRAHRQHGADFAGALKHGHQQRVDAGHEHHEENNQTHEEEDSVEHGVDLVVVGGQVDPFLQGHLLLQAVEARSEFCVDHVGVFGGVETDDEVGDAIALQQALGGGQGNAQIACVHFGDAGFDDAHDLNVDAVERAVGGHGEQGQAVADFHVHRLGQAGADEGFDVTAGFGREIPAGA